MRQKRPIMETMASQSSKIKLPSPSTYTLRRTPLPDIGVSDMLSVNGKSVWS